MRTLSAGMLAVALAFAAFPEARQPSSYVLEGRVATGAGAEVRPVRRARVTLTGRGLMTPRVADTDVKGAYRFDRLPAGEFKVSIRKPGFVPLDADGTANVLLNMTRAGAIEGMVTDSGGDPLPNVAVSAMQSATDGGAPKSVAQARTDDLGRYRIPSLAAGDYLIEAAADPAFIQGLLMMPGEKRPEVKRAYYPAAETVEAAKAIRVSAGRDTPSIDVTLPPAPPVIDPAAPPPPPRPDATGTARIAGRLMDPVSGRPIRGGRLLLVPLDGVALTNWKRTDSQGRFEYTQLEARRYRLTASADRFVSLEFGQRRPGEGGTPIAVRDGEDFKADMTLPRAAAIEGILFDEFGDGAPGVFVQVARKQYAAGRPRLIPLGGRSQSATTDDRGRYRVSGLEAGDYYIAGLSGAYTEQNETGGFAPTYYPGTTDAGAASPVTVAIGADAAAVTFALTPARTLSVAGMMVDAAGEPVGRGTIWLATPDRLRRMDFNLARGNTAPDGRFVLRNVPQGAYTLQGFGPPLLPPPGTAAPRQPLNLGAMRFGSIGVTVGDADLDGVVLKVTSGTELRGRIVLDDSSAPPPKPDQVRVTAIPVEFDTAPVGGGPPPSTTNADWTFEVTNMSGLRRVFVNVASPAWTLKKVTWNDKDITDTPIDLRTASAEDVEVVITPKVTVVSGAIPDDKGQPLTDYAVIVFSTDPTKWIDRSRFVAMVRPNQQGRFLVRGLPPDEYLAVALPTVVQTEWMDPAFLQQLRPMAASFMLGEGETRTLDLRLKKRP